MIMAVMVAMFTSIITATADSENNSGLVMITVMNLAKNCKADCYQARPDLPTVAVWWLDWTSQGKYNTAHTKTNTADRYPISLLMAT